MSVLEIIIRLTAVAVLVSYLCFKQRQRVRSSCEPSLPGQRTGVVTDVAKLKPRIDVVRHDYLAARHPTKGRCYHRALLEIARREVAQLGYFGARKEEDQSHTHAA